MSSMVVDAPCSPHLTARRHAVHRASNESLTAIRTSLGPWSPTACTHSQCNSADIQVKHDGKVLSPIRWKWRVPVVGSLPAKTVWGSS